jgi:hypothetical protein
MMMVMVMMSMSALWLRFAVRLGVAFVFAHELEIPCPLLEAVVMRLAGF